MINRNSKSKTTSRPEQKRMVPPKKGVLAGWPVGILRHPNPLCVPLSIITFLSSSTLHAEVEPAPESPSNKTENPIPNGVKPEPPELSEAQFTTLAVEGTVGIMEGKTQRGVGLILENLNRILTTYESIKTASEAAPSKIQLRTLAGQTFEAGISFSDPPRDLVMLHLYGDNKKDEFPSGLPASDLQANFNEPTKASYPDLNHSTFVVSPIHLRTKAQTGESTLQKTKGETLAIIPTAALKPYLLEYDLTDNLPGGTPLLDREARVVGMVFSPCYQTAASNLSKPFGESPVKGEPSGPTLKDSKKCLRIRSSISAYGLKKFVHFAMKEESRKEEGSSLVSIEKAHPSTPKATTLVDSKQNAIPILGLAGETAIVPGLSALTGIRISSTTPNGAAERAGIRSNVNVDQTDFILAVDGRPVHDVETLREILRSRKEGSSVKLTLFSKGEYRQVTLRIPPTADRPNKKN